MASMTASATTTLVARAYNYKIAASSAPVHGLSQMRMRGGRVTCSTEKEKEKEKGRVSVSPMAIGAASMLAAMSVSKSNPVLALVDERMSTEGTGLSLGLSNNLLGWILLGVFGFIWTLYTVYSSSIDDDEDSGLSL